MGPSLAARCFEHLALADHPFSVLQEFKPPAAAREDWPAFCVLMRSLAMNSIDDANWQIQLSQSRRWYQPQL